MRLLLLLLSPLFAGGAISAQDASPPELILILDASGSMWGRIGDEPKIVIARRAVAETLSGLPDEAAVGLIAYGHRRKGDCDDIETLASMATLDRAALNAKLEGLNPKGKTPIARALRTAFDAVESRGKPVSVILVSDGLETCDADPCQTVRDAKATGLPFVLHVVGFDVKEDEAAQLVCAAQAGGGAYYSAANAEELAGVLLRSAAAPEALPDGALLIKAVANGELTDVSIRVRNAETGEETAVGRTYADAGSNPRRLPLPDGAYRVKIRAVQMKGDVIREFDAVIDGDIVEKEFDFSTGRLNLTVARNGEPVDAVVRVYPGSEPKNEVAIARTYGESKTLVLTAGAYNLRIKPLKIDTGPEATVSGIVVKPAGDSAHVQDFAAGFLNVGVEADGAPAAAIVQVRSLDREGVSVQKRVSANPGGNAHTFALEPGAYRVEVRALKLPGKPTKELEVRVAAGETLDQTFDLLK